MGRPSSYTDEMAEKICELLPFADGGLEEICRAEGMPSFHSVYRWLNDPKRKAFREAYARATEEGGHVQAGRALRAALDAQDAQMGRLAFDARKWVASKLARRVYGDKPVDDDTGEDAKIEVTGGLPD